MPLNKQTLHACQIVGGLKLQAEAFGLHLVVLGLVEAVADVDALGARLGVLVYLQKTVLWRFVVQVGIFGGIPILLEVFRQK